MIKFNIRLVDHQTRCNVHGHELLEQQLGGIRQTHLRYLRLILTALALERIVAQIGNCDQAAEVADVHTIRIGDFEETFTQELCGTVRDLTITLHLTETQATITGSALHRLSHKNLNGTTSTRMDFVIHHVLKTLIVGGAKENLFVKQKI